MTEAEGGGINIQLTVDIAKGRNLVLLTHIDRGAGLPWINTMLDKLNDAADRQQAKYELEALEFQLANEERTLGEMSVAHHNIGVRHQNEWESKGRKGPYKIDAKEAQEKLNSESTMERIKSMIGILKQRISEHKAKISKSEAA